MKRTSIVLLLILAFTAGTTFAADHLLLSGGVGIMQPADSAYRDIYGSGVVYPEGALGIRLYRDLYLMSGVGVMSKKGTTPELGFAAKSTQTFITAGLGYLANISGGLKWKIEAGLADISYKEEAMDLSVSGSSLGWQAETGLMVMMGKTVFAGLTMGYLSASDTVEDVKIKLGGFRASVSIGVRL